MKAQLLLSSVLLAVAPALASTSFPVVCEMQDETLQFYLFVEGGGHIESPEGPVPVIWFEQAGATIIVDEADPHIMLVAWNSETGDATKAHRPGLLVEGTCGIGYADQHDDNIE